MEKSLSLALSIIWMYGKQFKFFLLLEKRITIKNSKYNSIFLYSFNEYQNYNHNQNYTSSILLIKLKNPCPI